MTARYPMRRRQRGPAHRHYVTPGIVAHRDSIEAAIREIESADPGISSTTWLEAIFRETQQAELALWEKRKE
jgi:hypothetical protein